MSKTELTENILCSAINKMIQGLIDADLGGGLVKKRIRLTNRGKSSGARTLIATNKGTKWFFVFGFQKNDRANIADNELEALKDLAQELLTRTGKQLDEAVQDGTLLEICNDHQT